MARLPTVGGDAGNWGNILNAFLSVSLDSGGALNSCVVGSTQIANNAVTATQADLNSLSGGMLLSGTTASRPSPSSSNTNLYYLETDNNGGTLFQSTGSSWIQVAAGVSQGPTGTAGGDLSGSYPNPTVATAVGGHGIMTTDQTQTISGAKTFTGEVIVPAPVNPTDAVNNTYMVAMAAALGW